MSSQTFQKFINLVAFDQNLVTLENSITAIREKLIDLQKSLSGEQAVLEEKVLEEKSLKKQIDTCELELKTLQEKENNKTKMLQQTTTSKEYDAANRELESIKVERNDKEQQLIRLFNVYEALEKEVTVFEQEFNEKQTSIQQQIEEQQEKQNQVQQNIDDLYQKREDHIKGVPEDWMSAYDHMKGKVENPVVSVVQDSCSACFYLISAKDLQDLKNNQLLQCKDCYRFLYFDAQAVA